MSEFLRSSKFIYTLIYLSYGNTLVILDMWPFSLDLIVNIKFVYLLCLVSKCFLQIVFAHTASDVRTVKQKMRSTQKILKKSKQ